MRAQVFAGSTSRYLGLAQSVGRHTKTSGQSRHLHNLSGVRSDGPYTSHLQGPCGRLCELLLLFRSRALSSLDWSHLGATTMSCRRSVYSTIWFVPRNPRHLVIHYITIRI